MGRGPKKKSVSLSSAPATRSGGLHASQAVEKEIRRRIRKEAERTGLRESVIETISRPGVYSAFPDARNLHYLEKTPVEDLRIGNNVLYPPGSSEARHAKVEASKPWEITKVSSRDGKTYARFSRVTERNEMLGGPIIETCEHVFEKGETLETIVVHEDNIKEDEGRFLVGADYTGIDLDIPPSFGAQQARAETTQGSKSEETAKGFPKWLRRIARFKH